MLYTKIQPQSFLGSGKKNFQEFLPYIDMVAILFNCAEPFEQIGNTLLTEGRIPSGHKILIITKMFYYFNHTLYVSANSL